MGRLIDFEEHKQNVELKLLELRQQRGEHIDVSSPLLRSTVGRHVRRTMQQYDRVRHIGDMVSIHRFDDETGGSGAHVHSMPAALIDDSDVRRLSAWCELADLPKHILAIGQKRVDGVPLSVWEWNELRRFRNWYQAREESYKAKEREVA